MTQQRPSPVTEHTPLPWHASRKSRYVSDYRNLVVAEIAPLMGFEANAALIVEAVNNHARLKARVIALEQVISEEMYPENCDDDANRMLLESAIDSHRRRINARSPSSQATDAAASALPSQDREGGS